MPIAGFRGIQSNANNFMGFGLECWRNSIQLWCSSIIFFLHYWLKMVECNFFSSVVHPRFSPWQAGGRRQKTLLICNPLSFPLPPDTTFCQNFFPFISTLLALQLRGVHFKHWVNMNLSETFSVKIFTQLKSFLYQEPRQRRLRFRMSGVGVNLIWGKRWVRKFADSGTESDR